jgi:hypothetical protein
MLAVASVAKIGIPIALGLLLASGKKKDGPQTMAGMLIVAPNGVVVVNPSMAAWVMDGLSKESATPIPGSPIGQATLGALAVNAPNALAWAQQQAATGKIVLLGIEGNNSLAAVPPGQEVSLAQKSNHKWAVLLEPPSASSPLGIPGGPGAPPIVSTGPDGQTTVNIPGLPPIPVSPGGQASPGQPQPGGGQTAPAGYVPGQNGQPGTFNIPGLGTIAIPPVFGPQGQGGAAPPNPQQPSDPNAIPPFVPGDGTTPPIFGGWPPPGFPNIPGLPSLPGAPPGPGGTAPAQGNRPQGATVWMGNDGRYRYAIRSGDIASRMAQWFTGNFARWRELEQVNPELKLVLQGGKPYGYTPWRLDQVLVLPPGWDGSKGPQVQTVAGGAGIAVGAY